MIVGFAHCLLASMKKSSRKSLTLNIFSCIIFTMTFHFINRSIGEMSLVYAAKRRFSAYAASNLQLLVLEAFDFASILEMYPLTRKDILQGLLQYKRESFLVKAWKLKAKDVNKYTKEQETNTQFVKKYFVQNAYHIPVGGNVIDNENYKVAAELKWYQRFIGYGCNQNIQHYIYFSNE